MLGCGQKSVWSGPTIKDAAQSIDQDKQQWPIAAEPLSELVRTNFVPVEGDTADMRDRSREIDG